MDLFINDQAKVAAFPRGMPRTSLSGTNPISWTSKYGSVVVTGLGVATSDGINEKGLSANALYLGTTTYEKPDSRPALDVGHWAQYVLDNFATVQEVLDALPKIRIASFTMGGHNWPAHLSIEDASGDSAIIEFDNGKQEIHHGREYTVMTNEPPMNVQLANLKRYKPFGGSLPLPGDIDPLSRFVRAATFAKTAPKPTSQADAIAVAADVVRTAAVPPGAQDYSANDQTEDTWPTLWIAIADLTHKTYYFQSMTSPNVFWVDLSKVDFRPGTKLGQVDAYDPKLSGDITGQLKALSAVAPAATN